MCVCVRAWCGVCVGVGVGVCVCGGGGGVVIIFTCEYFDFCTTVRGMIFL